MKRVPATIAVVLLTSACSSLPEPEGPTTPLTPATPVVQTTPPPTTTPLPPTTPTAAARPATAFEPVGNYTFSVDIGGNAAAGTISVVKGEDGKLGGSVNSDQGSISINSVVVEGRKMVLSATLPNGPDIVFVLNFEANHNDYTGSLDVQGMSGTLSGTRKKS